VRFEENLNNEMGLEFYNLSHRFGYQSPNWPYFEDVKIERIHYMAKSGVLSQRITTSMHNTTHIDAPAHVVQGTPFIDEVPLPHFFGSGIVVAAGEAVLRTLDYAPLTGIATHQRINYGTCDRSCLQVISCFAVGLADLEHLAQQMVGRNGANPPPLPRIQGNVVRT